MHSMTSFGGSPTEHRVALNVIMAINEGVLTPLTAGQFAPAFHAPLEKETMQLSWSCHTLRNCCCPGVCPL